jgi:lysophospholipase L1-like esterase
MKNKGLLLLSIICSIICIVSCAKNKTYKVKVIYEHDIESVEYEVKKNENITLDYKILEHGCVKSFKDSEGNIFDETSPITQDITLYAVWEMEQYTYKFYDLDRTTVLKEVTADYGSEIEYIYLEDTRGEGLTIKFVSWSAKDEILTKNINFYPVVKYVYDEINITYLDENKNESSTKTVQYGDYISAPTKTSYEENGMYALFLGWYDEATDELFDFDEPVKTDVTLYPKYDVAPLGTVSLASSTISIIGDSISTYYSRYSSYNSFYTGDNQFYYPRYSSFSSNPVTLSTETWWVQTILGVGAKLGINNSLSGSCAYSGSTAGQSVSRLKTLGGNGTPNIVILYIGTNDNATGNTTEQVKSAYEVMIDYITKNYVAKIDGVYVYCQIYIFTHGYSAYTGMNYTEERRIEYNNMLTALCEQNDNCHLVDIASIITKDNYTSYLGDNLHYNSQGHLAISTLLIERLQEDYNETSKQNKIYISKKQNHALIKRKGENE